MIHGPDSEPMRHHGPNFSLERSLGHAVMAETMTAEEATDYMDAYYGALDPPEPELPEAA